MSYKANTISIESVKVIKHKSDVYIYWDNPIGLYGNIKYKICNDKNEEDIIEYMPYKIPITIKIAAIYSIEINDNIQTFESALSLPIILKELQRQTVTDEPE